MHALMQMDKNELKQKYTSDLAELRKLINSWNFIPEAPNDEFDALAHKVLGHLYMSSDFEKITRIISSELTVNYGLYASEYDSEKLTEEIFEWWQNK